jgi:hypothetical protein
MKMVWMNISAMLSPPWALTRSNANHAKHILTQTGKNAAALLSEW